MTIWIIAKKLSVFGAISFFVCTFVACYSSEKTEQRSDSGPDGDVDADGDSDADIDGDTDADADGDTDADSDAKSLNVDPDDQVCSDEDECTVVWLDCSGDRYAAVNVLVDEEYIEALQELCGGVPPEQPLFSAVAECYDGVCTFTGIAPSADEATACSEPADCVWASTRCDSCECYEVAINTNRQDEASAFFSEVCQDFAGAVCDIDCPEPPALTCPAGQCFFDTDSEPEPDVCAEVSYDVSDADRLAPCIFELDSEVIYDPDKINVYCNDEVIGFDTNCNYGLGWDWADDAPTSFRLCDQACEQLRRGECDTITVKQGCNGHPIE